MIRYDIQEKRFFKVKIENEEEGPIPREFHQAALLQMDDKPCLVVVGGGDKNGKLNDI